MIEYINLFLRDIFNSICRSGVIISLLFIVISIVYLCKNKPFTKKSKYIAIAVEFLFLLLSSLYISLGQSSIYSRRYDIDTYLKSEFFRRWQDSLWVAMYVILIIFGIYLLISILRKSKVKVNVRMLVFCVLAYSAAAMGLYITVCIRTGTMTYNPLVFNEGIVFTLILDVIWKNKEYKKISLLIYSIALVQLLAVFIVLLNVVITGNYAWYSYFLNLSIAGIPLLAIIYNIILLYKKDTIKS